MLSAKSNRSRLVVVSNRLPGMKAVGGEERLRPIGGLATAVEAALSQRELGGVWIGWSGKTTSGNDRSGIREISPEPIRLLGLDLTENDVEAYYNGFCNKALWPILHGFPGLATLSRSQLDVYRSVNRFFAREIMSQLNETDLVWIHDYHLLSLGHDLRKLGWKGKIGFFLHVPFPSMESLEILPDYQELLRMMRAFDLVGFQTKIYRDNYTRACELELGSQLNGNILVCGDSKQIADVFPVGIDVNKFLPHKGDHESGEGRVTLGTPFHNRDIVLGVDRLDYTKGLPERTIAFETLLKSRPEIKRTVSMVQVCSPSRTKVFEYVEQKKRMDSLVGRINGELSEHDWEPIRYLYRTYSQEELVNFYRDSKVGLVTPLRDGMNLVAKEFVAAQYPDDPGVLTLSKFAGAAEQMTEAILVNPYIPEDTADGIALALEMPKEERIERHQALLKKVQGYSVQKWANEFVSALSGG